MAGGERQPASDGEGADSDVEERLGRLTTKNGAGSPAAGGPDAATAGNRGGEAGGAGRRRDAAGDNPDKVGKALRRLRPPAVVMLGLQCASQCFDAHGTAHRVPRQHARNPHKYFTDESLMRQSCCRPCCRGRTQIRGRPDG